MIEKSKNKKLLTIKILSIFLLFLTFFLIINYSSADSGLDDNFTGFAWSDNTGWISFNHGTNIDTDGYLTGYAWSDNIGWISFNSADLTDCPSTPCNAKLDENTKKIVGWARYLNSETGWIKLGPNIYDSADYGLSLSEGDILGWAWSDELGWISFNCQNDLSCAQSNYGVEYVPSISATNLTSNIYYCAHDSTVPKVNDGLAVKLSWTYSGDSAQKFYTIKISEDINFEINTLTLGPVESASSEMFLSLLGTEWNNEKLDWSTEYYWQIEAESENGGKSSLVASSFTIERAHGSPHVVFSHVPEQIIIDNEIEFDGQSSVTFNESTPTYSWLFVGGTPEESSEVSPKITFSELEDSSVSLTVTDSAGYSCTVLEPLQVYLFNPPIWKDVSPF
jgi:hypothetical protein